jgi:hypothetical protein
MKDPAADGPEVKIISFFRMFPNGSFTRRVNSITNSEMSLRFILFHAEQKLKKLRRLDEIRGAITKPIISASAWEPETK